MSESLQDDETEDLDFGHTTDGALAAEPERLTASVNLHLLSVLSVWFGQIFSPFSLRHVPG
jgi:hypothetical protein